MNYRMMALVISILVIALLSESHTSAQGTTGSAGQSGSSQKANRQGTGVPAGQGQASFYDYFAGDSDDPRLPIMRRLNEVKKTLKDAKSTEEKAQAKTTVSKALGDYFDRDMEHRRSELDRLKKRSTDMSALLAKRVAAKDDLVDLQLKSFQHDADGLGLFGEQRNAQPSNIPYPASVAPAVTVAGNVYQSGQSAGDSNPRDKAMNRANEARRKLRTAESAEAESKATTELKSALSDYFDRDIEIRQKELEEVNKGLKTMEERLQKRANSKDEIVDLQLQLFVNEAEGLGFFSGSDANASSRGSYRGPNIPTYPVGPGSTQNRIPGVR